MIVTLLFTALLAYGAWRGLVEWRGADYNLNGVITPTEAERFLEATGYKMFESGEWFFEVKVSDNNRTSMNLANQLRGWKSLTEDDARAYFGRQALGGIALVPYSSEPCVYKQFDASEGSTWVSTETRCEMPKDFEMDAWGAGKRIYYGTPGFLKISVHDPEACFVGDMQSLGGLDASRGYQISFRATRGVGCGQEANYFDNW